MVFFLEDSCSTFEEVIGNTDAKGRTPSEKQLPLKGSVLHTVQSGHLPHLVTRTFLTLQRCETRSRMTRTAHLGGPSGAANNKKTQN